MVQTPSRKLKRWRNSLSLEKHREIFYSIYADVNEFGLSLKDRAINDALELVYGEIDFESFIAVVSLCKPSRETIFYDLGSGTGKAVIACAMVFNIRKSCGIELLPTLHQCASQQLQRLTSFNQYCFLSQKIVFEQDNFLHVALSEATLLFINATTYFGDYWGKICNHIDQVSPGSQVISTGKALHSQCFIVQKIVLIKMSWGVVNAFIQERN